MGCRLSRYLCKISTSSTQYLHYLHNIYSGVVTRSWARLAPAPGAARVVVECVSLDTVHSAADSLTVQLQCEYSAV